MTEKKLPYRKPHTFATPVDSLSMAELKFQERLKEVRKDLARVNEKKESLRKTNKLLQQDIKRLEEECRGLKTGSLAEALEAEKKQLEENIAELKIRVAEGEALGDKIKSFEDRTRALRDDNRELKQQQKLLKKIIQEMERRLAVRKRKKKFSRPQIRHVRKARVALLVDVQNLFYSARSLFGGWIDFNRLKEAALEDRELARAVAYVIKGPQLDDKFFTVLRKSGYQVREKELVYREDGTRKGNWDIGIVIDSLQMLNDVDVMVLASGDGDFVELVNFLKSRMIRVEIMSFPQATAHELKVVADRYYPMGEEFIFKKDEKKSTE